VLPRSLLVAATLALLLVPACDKGGGSATESPGSSERSGAFDGSPEFVIEALRAGAEGDLRAACTDELAAELDGENLAELGAAIEQLGAHRESERIRTEELVGGGEHALYLLRFSGGDSEFELDVDGSGRISAFRLAGGDLERALAEVRNTGHETLEVVQLQFRDAEGNPIADDAIVGRHVEYDLTVSGILEAAGSFHLTVEARVFDAKGKEIYGRPVVFEAQFDASPDGRPVGTVHGSFDLLSAGAHEISFEVVDDNGHGSVTHKAQIFARAAPGGS
jgi:hypothetical protein